MDMAFVQHIEYHLENDGIAVILLSPGVLFRNKGGENIILQKLIDDNILDSIIGIPEKTFSGTKIKAIIMVLKKNKKHKNYFILDASNLYVKQGPKNIIQDKHVDKILNLLNERKDTDISKVLSLEKIQKNNYNLNIARYISEFKEENIDIFSLNKNIEKNLIKLNNLEKLIIKDLKNMEDLI